ncbi:MAG: hypothetical protein H6577_27005 [Lewinellaceae bacterium]|nr:hypothetical protein [Saprospiraceae bacterium]MCB9341792.1 hypothetical protein [Lewinellaceae bacterium]
MRLAVTDANIFIDLIKLDLVAHLFVIELEIFTTAEVLEELNDHQTEVLNGFHREGLLSIHVLTNDQHKAVGALKIHVGLSYTDRTVIVLAKVLGAIVVTGDGAMRRFCGAQKLEVRGILWLFDCFLQFQCISHAIAVEKMEGLMRINNRLPVEECLERLKKWRGGT